MAFIKFFFLLLKIFEKVEKTGTISTKFSFRCTPSVILGAELAVSGSTKTALKFKYEIQIGYNTYNSMYGARSLDGHFEVFNRSKS